MSISVTHEDPPIFLKARCARASSMITLAPNRAGSKTPPRRAGRIMIIQRSDARVVRAAGWPSSEPKDHSNASGTRGQWQPRQLLTRCGTATNRIRNRTYLHLIAPNALLLPPTGRNGLPRVNVTSTRCTRELNLRPGHFTYSLLTADFRHMHILRSGRVVESKRLSQRLRSLAFLALVSYRWHSNLTGDRQ